MAEPEKSDIFLHPDQLPPLRTILRELQRLKGENFKLDPEFARKVVEIAESGKNAVVRLSQETPELDPQLDTCVLCDKNDVCDPCDASDFLCDGMDTCIFSDSCASSDHFCPSDVVCIRLDH
ncbi:MAG: hypothetical protein JW712_04270 [Dehalococcoidales bacterium]|nr:hypothetical protein [Dehalococcoidales bacterium]